MNTDRVTSWDFLKAMFQPDDKIGVMAYEAKAQIHKATENAEQRVLTRDEALSPEFTRHLKKLNARGLNIVVGMNPLTPDATTRSKDNVASIRHLVMDIDTKRDPGTGQDITGKQRLDAMLADPACPRPYYILNTSPGNYQALWRVAGFSREEAETVQKALGAHYGGDRNISTDISRGVRLPGLHNKKYETTFPVTCQLCQALVHRPEAFAYLPRERNMEQSQPGQAQPIHPDLAATPQPQRDPEPRGGVATPQYSNSGSDRSGSGMDWGHCNRDIYDRLSKEGVSAFESILQSQRTYLTASAQERRKPNARAYAETTINKLRTHWTPRLREFAFTPEPRQATATSTSVLSVSPTAEDPRRPVSKDAATATAPAPEIPAPGNPNQYNPAPDIQRQYSQMIQQYLRDGYTPEEIYNTFMEWKLKDVAGAEVYLTAQIIHEQQNLRAESLVDRAKLFLDQPPPELEAFRRLLDAQTPGDGVLMVAQKALEQTQQQVGVPPYQPVTGSPANNPSTQAHAMRLATLAFVHGDTPNSVAQALTAKYHPNIPIDQPPQHISALVQQAQTTQALALTNHERGTIR